ALGYKVVHLLPIEQESPEQAKRASISFHTDSAGGVYTHSHPNLSVSVDKSTGCITSLKEAGFETLASGACGNELQAFKDTPKDYDAWNIDPGTLDVPPTLLNKVDSVELINPKAPRPAIRVVRSW